jgi:hypothetical protein
MTERESIAVNFPYATIELIGTVTLLNAHEHQISSRMTGTCPLCHKRLTGPFEGFIFHLDNHSRKS